MNVHAASKLDMEKFRKVHRLMTGGATEGERAAAKARAETMAAKAGMTLKDAVSKLDGLASPPKPRSLFQEMEDAMEEAHPGWKAERAERETQRERERAALRAEAIAEYGSEEAVFAETPRERMLREALEPLANRATYANSRETYISGYAGWTCRKPPSAVRDALARAYPFPKDIAGVWRERNDWERRQDIRCAFEPAADMPVRVRARLAALEHMLDTMAAPTFEGVGIRLEWLQVLNERGYSRDQEEDAHLIDALRFDFSFLRERAEAAEPAHPRWGGVSRPPFFRTTAEKRAAILSMLDTHPELSDREIARRLGVSPQTVNTWRKKRGRV